MPDRTMPDVDKPLVLVTGATGFVGKWVVVRLLEAGYRVRGTIRGLARADEVRRGVATRTGAAALDRLALVEADILEERGWAEAMAGAGAVMHVATVVRGDEPRDSSIVIRPAVEGTERVLRFAHAAGIQRFILTSSIATVGYGLGHTRGRRVYTEKDFTSIEAMRWTWAYCIGKTRAEQAAWAFARANDMALTTIHPGAIIGPALDRAGSVSLQMVSGLLDRTVPALPSNGYSIIDVRDVADLHVAALEHPESAGERYLATAEYTPFPEVARILQAAYPDRRIPTAGVPDWIIRLIAMVGGPARQIINDIGNEKIFDGAKGEGLLGRKFIPAKQAILDTAESVIRLGLVKG
jgi:nucleoside-diphosphate-sugar epimerase